MKNCFIIIVTILTLTPLNSVFSQSSFAFNLIDSKPYTPESSKEFDINKDYVPYVQVFLPEKRKATGRGIMIFPGGGYGMVAFGHEGTRWAPFFKEQGITVFVVKYSLPKGDRNRTFKDVITAMNIIKSHASNWNLNLKDVGVMGFSAGGHLASTLATHFTEPIKPAFQILFYPVITMDTKYTHQGSRDNFLGKNPSQKLIDEFSNEKQVNEKTSPAFIVFAEDDQVVPPQNSIRYFEVLLKEKIPAELHAYPTGNHGWGYSNSYKYHVVILEKLKTWLTLLKIENE